MKRLLSLVLLLPLISSCAVYEGMKVERTTADFEKKETKVQGEVDREQRDIDRVEKVVNHHHMTQLKRHLIASCDD